MTLVETKGQLFVDVRNQLTGRQDVMDGKIKKALYNIVGILSVADFTARVQVFQQVVDLVQQHKLGRYLYYPVEAFDLGLFLQHVNKFAGSLEVVVGMLALESERGRVVAKVRGLLKPVVVQVLPVMAEATNVPVMDREKWLEIKRGLKKSKKSCTLKSSLG